MESAVLAVPSVMLKTMLVFWEEFLDEWNKNVLLLVQVYCWAEVGCPVG